VLRSDLPVGRARHAEAAGSHDSPALANGIRSCLRAGSQPDREVYAEAV